MYYAVFQAVYGFARATHQISENQDRVHQAVIHFVTTHGKAGTGRYFGQRMRLLYGLRIKADYLPEDVGDDELREIHGDAEKIRNFFINKPIPN